MTLKKRDIENSKVTTRTLQIEADAKIMEDFVSLFSSDQLRRNHRLYRLYPALRQRKSKRLGLSDYSLSDKEIEELCRRADYINVDEEEEE